MKTHRSKIGLELFIPLIVVMLTSIIMLFLRHQWVTFGIVIVAMAFALHVAFTTYYTLDGTKLKVKSGFLINREIDIPTITKIRSSNNPLSAPAASLDRIEVFFNEKDSVLLSPQNKEEFINDLKAINPSIEVTLKPKK